MGSFEKQKGEIQRQRRHVPNIGWQIKGARRYQTSKYHERNEKVQHRTGNVGISSGNDIQIKVWYGVDVDEGLDGLFEDGEINIYADNTKTVRETAITVIHEATHAKINKPNTKNQELQCYMNEYRHQNIELTEKVVQDIMNHINDKYPNLKWE